MRGLVIILALALAACATPQPINTPLTGARLEMPGREPAGEDLIVLALSGGGARAAAFALGAMQALRDIRGRDGAPLTEHVALITSVSGGSILAAHYGLHGPAGLDSFRAAYLDKTWRLNAQYLPRAWINLASGGVNGPDRLADWLDREVYGGARMAALARGPRIVINASDLYNATPFAFAPFYFDGICSDLGEVRVGDAVAASMAVPVMFRPVLAESFGGQCATPDWVARAEANRDAPEMLRQSARAFRNYTGAAPARQRYLHLVDGGVVDNFGLSSLAVMCAVGPPPAPLTAREAVQARRILVLVVNAEYVRERTWQTQTAAPGIYEMLYSSLDVATEASKRSALDAFRAALPQLQHDLRQFRCGLAPEDARALGREAAWNCEDIAVSMEVVSLHDLDDPWPLIATETVVSLPAERVSQLIAAGRAVTERNAAVRALRGE